VKHRSKVGLAAVLAAVAAVLSAAGGAGSASSPTLSASTARFPDRVYALTIPSKRRLTAADVTVTENGRDVNGLTVTAPGGGGLTTVLLIDTSDSMRGAPLQDAIKAARAFAAQRTQNARLGIVFFNKKTTVALAPTLDGAAITRALSVVPSTAEGTRIFDALGVAADQLRAVGSPAAAVVLTDGADVGSTVSQADALLRLADARARVFSVGLHSAAFRPETLQTLSASTGGVFTEAGTSAALAKIFSALGYQLSNEYLLLYRSLLGPKEKVDVAVRVNGFPGTLKDSYTTPALGLGQLPFQRSFFDKVITSWWLAVLVTLVTVLLFSWGISSAAGARSRSLQTRMSRFVTLEPTEDGLSRERLGERFDSFSKAVELRAQFFRRFAERCDIAGIETSPTGLLLGSTLGGLTLGIVLAAAWSPWFIVIAVVAPFTVVRYVRSRLALVRRRFGRQLPDNLDVLASALRAGHSLVGALVVMARDAHEPSKREFERVVSDEQLGVPLDDSLKQVGQRMENRDMAQVALIALLQRETGSSSAEVIDHVAGNVRARQDVQRLVRTLTAQGRLARWIASLLPLGMLLAISVIQPGYLHPLFHQTVGQVFVVVGAIMIVVASLVIKRIVEIKV
jgi:tight adherence protein B